MQKKLLHVLLTLMLISAAVSSQAAVSFLTSTQTPQTLTLNCTFTNLGALNQFSYALTNPVANTVVIRGFTLQFPGVPTGDFAVTQTPTGWFNVVIPPPDSIINWTWNGSLIADRLDPGETFNFTFTTALPFGGDIVANASAQNGFGFSGNSCGPVIPEPMSIMLSLMGLGSVIGAARLRRR